MAQRARKVHREVMARKALLVLQALWVHKAHLGMMDYKARQARKAQKGQQGREAKLDL